MPIFKQAQRITIQRETNIGSTSAVAATGDSGITVTAAASGGAAGYTSTNGSLSATTFTLDANTYTIEQLLSQNNNLEFRLDRALPFGAQVELVIGDDTHTFDVEDAQIDQVSGDFLYTWSLTTLSAGTWTLNIRQVAGSVISIPVSDWTMDIQSTHDERTDFTGSGLRPRGAETQRIANIGFTTPLAWQGDDYHGLRTVLTDVLSACGFYGTPADTASNWEYHQSLPDLAIVSQVIGSSLAISHDDGRNHSIMTGARGSVSLTANPGASVRLSFSFKAHITETPSSETTRLADPDFVVARGSQRATITLQTSGNTPANIPHDDATSFELNVANSFDAPPSATGDGYGNVQINGREPVVTMNVLLSATAGNNPAGYTGLLEDQAYRATMTIDDGADATVKSLEIVADPLEVTAVADADTDGLIAKGLTMAVREGTSPLEFRWSRART